ncbi:MAG: glycosyltransferase, partial [Pseudomonadota bacterium]
TTELPLRTVWDPLSRHEVRREVRRVDAPLVQTYMGRATRLTHLPRKSGYVHVARLGGYYKLDGYRHADAWIGNTRGLCDWLVANGMPADRVFHIYNFADLPPSVEQADLVALRHALGARDDDWLMLTSGRFVEVKGQRYALEALARMPAEVAGRRPRLLLLGDGPLGEALRRQAETLDIQERIIWAGWQQQPAPYYHLADMVVFPSRDGETLGNVILEAWAYRKPLVTAAFRGAREIARHGEDALVVPCDDPAALADAMERLTRDGALQQALTAQGAGRLEAEFSKEVIVGQYRALYRELISKR